MLWLREPTAMPDLPRDRIIADAYAALNPKPELWLKYNEEIERLRTEGHLEEDDVVFLRYGKEAQEALMDETRGNPDAFTAGTVTQVLQRSREVAKADADKRVKAAEGRARSAVGQLVGSREQIRSAAQAIGNFVATTVLVVLSALILLGLIYGPVGPVQEPFVPGILQVVAAVCALAAGIVTMFFRPTLLEHRKSAAVWMSSRIEGFALRALRLNESPSATTGDESES
jgi:hypothetical protein